MSLLASILKHAILTPQRTAVVDDRRSYTYAQLAAGAMFLAEKIDQITSAANVGIMLPTSGGFPIALLGVWLARRTAVPFNYLLHKDELAFVLRDSRIDTLITVGPMLDWIGGAAVVPENIRILRLEEVDFTGVPPLRWPPLLAPEQDAVVLYTSGTSGRPKGVVLSHRNLESNTWGGIRHARITQADVFLGVLPQFHSFGLTGLTLIPLTVASKVVYTARFTPRKIVQLIREHRPEVIMAVPSMYGALLTVKDASADDFQTVRFAVSGGEPLPAPLEEEYRARFHLQLLEGYGLTETSPVITWSTPYAFRTRSVGTPVPGVEVRIVDEKNRPLPPGGEGEIIVAGPNIMKGYFHRPELTAQVIFEASFPGSRPTRWFRTGDLGRLDADGFLFITGRKKEMLKVAGEMVIPREIEEVLARHDSVHEAAVIGKTDDLRGEVPVAFIELKEGATFDENALRDWCRQSLAPFKVPRDIRAIEKLPRSATGKVLRRELKAE